jgi:putative oxidoreductase
VITARTEVRDRVVLALALAVGAVFLYAGIDKIRDPLHFSDSINAFAILPPALIDVSAFALPFFEIICAILVFLPPTRRVGALALMLASSMFFVALLSALLRGLTLDCGCFGAGAPSRPRMWAELGLDALLIGGAAFSYYYAMFRPRRDPVASSET